jgi:hypothetical protein
MRDLPIALTFDLDSDLFDESVAPTGGHSKISWRGISEGIPLIRERLARVGHAFGVKPVPTWFVRADNQIADIYGRPAHLLIGYGDLFRMLREAGEEIAWHPHLYRREGGGWRQETDDAVLDAHMTAALADMTAAGFPPLCGRIGEAYGSNGIMAAFDALKIPYASSSMPGRKRIDAERSLDWEPTPRIAYHPSVADYRVPGKPSRRVLEIPFSMLMVKADYDAQPFLRYLDLSYRADAVAVGLDELIRQAPYIVAVTHPSALLPEFRPEGGHGLVSFDVQNLEDSLSQLIERARATGRAVRFLRLSDIGLEQKASLDGG